MYSLKAFVVLIAMQTVLTTTADVKVITSNIGAKEELYVISQVMDLLEKDVKTQAMVRNLVDSMDSQYGKGWIGQIVTNANNKTEFYTNYGINSYIIIEYKDIQISLYKTNTTTDIKTHILDVIKSARSSKAKPLFVVGVAWEVVEPQINKLEQIFKNYTSNFENHKCFETLDSFVWNDCWKDISYWLSQELPFPDVNEIVVSEKGSVGVYGYRNTTAYYEFILGDLYIVVTMESNRQYKCK